jgi:hypothetical protein
MLRTAQKPVLEARYFGSNMGNQICPDLTLNIALFGAPVGHEENCPQRAFAFLRQRNWNCGARVTVECR